MTEPSSDEDNAPPRPRWLGWLIAVVMAAIALGVVNIGWRIMQTSPAEQAAAAQLQRHPELAEGKRLVETSDCMRCHGWERHYVGPSFIDIAQRYRDRPDAAEYLARKIREGGAGEWGSNAVMPRHPHIDAAQSLQMAHWLLAARQPSQNQ